MKTSHFLKQVENLQKKYRRIQSDIDDFCIGETLDSSAIDHGEKFYKFRMKNSSIPTGKRGGFRIIAKIHDGKLYPFLIYAKTEKENATIKEIEDNYEKMIRIL